MGRTLDVEMISFPSTFSDESRELVSMGRGDGADFKRMGQRFVVVGHATVGVRRCLKAAIFQWATDVLLT